MGLGQVRVSWPGSGCVRVRLGPGLVRSWSGYGLVSGSGRESRSMSCSGLGLGLGSVTKSVFF